ncbi:MAG TPA: DUF421 domain-containing protein [Bacillota bacterium]|nr:DUF421 domain-containing protein [Bacillota bacterium]
MELVVYAVRCIVAMLVTWLAVRLLGRRSIAQMTAYDFAAMLVMGNVIAEPLVYKIESKAFIGTMIIVGVAVSIGVLSLQKKFYNFDVKPSILIANGKVLQDELRSNRLNLPFLLSLLRAQGYNKVSDVEFAILEPTGSLSVIPRSQARPVQPQDLKINTDYEGLALPLIIDGEIQYNNLKYAQLTVDWLQRELRKAGAGHPREVFLAELSSNGELFVDFYKDQFVAKPDLI